MIDYIIHNWYIILAAILCAVIDGNMDRLNFHKKHNSGYMSLTYPVKVFIGADFWHDSKKLGILISIVLVSYLQYGITTDALFLAILLAIINYIGHELVLHYTK